MSSRNLLSFEKGYVTQNQKWQELHRYFRNIEILYNVVKNEAKITAIAPLQQCIESPTMSNTSRRHFSEEDI